MISVQIVGKEALDRKFDGFQGHAGKAIDRAVQRGGELLRDFTKKMPPVSAKRTGYNARGIPVDTGRLRQSIQKRKLQQFAAGVAPGVKHGLYVHEGTDRMQARPYFDWALEMGAEKEIDALFVDSISPIF